jgi:hypothetical protein
MTAQHAKAVKDLVRKLTSIVGSPLTGYDTEGQEYDSLLEMWRAEGVAAEGASAKAAKAGQEGTGEELRWYSDAFNYWEVKTTPCYQHSIPWTIDFMVCARRRRTARPRWMVCWGASATCHLGMWRRPNASSPSSGRWCPVWATSEY